MVSPLKSKRKEICSMSIKIYLGICCIVLFFCLKKLHFLTRADRLLQRTETLICLPVFLRLIAATIEGCQCHQQEGNYLWRVWESVHVYPLHHQTDTRTRASCRTGMSLSQCGFGSTLIHWQLQLEDVCTAATRVWACVVPLRFIKNTDLTEQTHSGWMNWTHKHAHTHTSKCFTNTPGMTSELLLLLTCQLRLFVKTETPKGKPWCVHVHLLLLTLTQKMQSYRGVTTFQIHWWSFFHWEWEKLRNTALENRYISVSVVHCETLNRTHGQEESHTYTDLTCK